jgi:hypothetical protein
VGSLKLRELKDSGYYKTHLGARGVFRAIAALPSCNLAVLSEFGAECCGHREWFATMLQNHFNDHRTDPRPRFRCFPSDRKTCVIGGRQGLQIARSDALEAALPYDSARVVEPKDPDGTLDVVARASGSCLRL